MEKAFQAYGSGPEAALGDTPRQAAMLYFRNNPKRRKCSIVEGTYADGFSLSDTAGHTHPRLTRTSRKRE